MSANDDGFDLGADLESLLNDTTPPPAPKKAAAKKAAPPKEEPVEEVPTPPVPTQEAVAASVGEAVITPEDLKKLLAENVRLQNQLDSLLAAKTSDPDSHRSPTEAYLEPGGLDPATEAYLELGDSKALGGVRNPQTFGEIPEIIHFESDGFTIGGKVWYRGEEYRPRPKDGWAGMSIKDQMTKFGSVMFRPGPWDGLDFDLDDPNLSEEDRSRLLAISNQRK